jgi:hypothetical protein
MTMDFLNRARQIELNVARSMTEAAKSLVQSSTREPIELLDAILGAVEREIQSAGRGTRRYSRPQTTRGPGSKRSSMATGRCTLTSAIVCGQLAVRGQTWLSRFRIRPARRSTGQTRSIRSHSHESLEMPRSNPCLSLPALASR